MTDGNALPVATATFDTRTIIDPTTGEPITVVVVPDGATGVAFMLDGDAYPRVQINVGGDNNGITGGDGTTTPTAGGASNPNPLKPSTITGNVGTTQTVAGGDATGLYGGYLDLFGGHAGPTGKGGKVNITGGDGLYGGTVYVTGGTGTSGAGSVTISGGAPTGTATLKGADFGLGSGAGGEADMRGGSGGLTTGQGGPVGIRGGDAQGGDANGGDISIIPGNKHGTGTPGSTYLYAQAGHVVIEIGDQKIGFFDTDPVAKPTGVAVTAAAIHAALVTLGLIGA